MKYQEDVAFPIFLSLKSEPKESTPELVAFSDFLIVKIRPKDPPPPPTETPKPDFQNSLKIA